MKTFSQIPASVKTAAVAAILALVFALNTRYIVSHEDIHDSNFVKFWIAGQMVGHGLNPYDPAQWRAAHLSAGAPSVPDRIFLYPLPQAFFLVPLAWLPVEQAFVLWCMLSQVLIALACYGLLSSTPPPSRALLLPLVLFLLFFGPIYLSLQIGSIGAIALALLVFSILALNRRRDLLAGLLLSFLILKPSQGLPILVLAGLWFIFRRRLRPIYGMLTGGVVLLLSGLLYEPRWVEEFLNNSGLVSARTLGAQSNVYSFADLACNQDTACTWTLGSAAALLLIGLGAFILWHNRAAWTHWEAFNLIILVGFLCAVYSWSYDQMLYVIPITWIAVGLFSRYRSYVPVLAFLVILDVVAFVALGVQAYTKQDLLSLLTTLLVLGMIMWLERGGSRGEMQRDAALAPSA